MLMTNVDAIRRFTRAGKATITLSSTKTGRRYTYKVTKVPDSNDRFFVKILTGPNNEADFQYLGFLQGTQLKQTARSCAHREDPQFLAVLFFCQKVLKDGNIPDGLEVRHEGRCGRCNRKLTTPESIDRGIGPECWSRM